MYTKHIDTKILHDILTTAVEGGIDYWIPSNGIHEVNRMKDGTVESIVFDQEVLEEDAGIALPFDGPEIILDSMLLEEGIMMAAEEVCAIRGDLAQLARDLFEGVEDGSNVDAEAADVFVQIALFGEIVYS